MPYDQRPDSLPLDVDECRTAIWMVRGNVTKAAEIMKVPSSRLRNFVKGSKFLSAEVREAQEQLLDIAEDVAYDALIDSEDKSRQDQMARFIMTNLGKDRGYGQGSGKSGVNVNLPGKGRMMIAWDDGTAVTGGGNTIEHKAAE